MIRRQLLTQLEPTLLIAVGGFAGANLRQFVDLLVPGTLPGTLAVNILGSFALGVLIYDSLDQQAIGDNSRLVFGTGFLSSFTTYSTFVIDTLLAEPLTAVGYVGVSYLCGFLAVLVGRWFVGGGDR
ncbi:CrcB protein [Halohasta litchfieldiae]|jgi:CrcB protein|uniref:Fluoride-specific ion channel FluC n=1 Tax=Halohasta litchfieldiae TaxID=1073996 RepID=A0A1H6WB01_9EURY|nr:CrcB family protein [Halohasta litchfieldiae]ATW90019.1 CrcB protein [Halohasta litchfieldiae]SEJ14148.1 CrcB protein [Halohasta litchfieldiae]